MREFDQAWPAVTSSGAQEAVQVTGDPLKSAWYVQASTGSTNTITIQSGPTSTGPWFDEGSTAVAVGAVSVLRIDGPFGWVRPFATSTGALIRGIGVSG